MTVPSRSRRLAHAVHWAGLGLGPILAVLAYFLLPHEHRGPDGVLTGLTSAGRATAAVGILMAVWWITEAIPLSATALLPLVLFPLTGALDIQRAAAPYAGDVIFLFLGGFILGLAMERWGLHKRIALITVSIVGTGPKRIVGGFMLATALLSMWVSNTSTTLMMLPIATSVIALVAARCAPPGTPPESAPSPDPNFDSTLILGVAYAATIGGVGTLIGTPPNVILKGFVKQHLGFELGFVNWLVLGLPLVACFLVIAWWYMTCISQPVRLREIPGGRALIRGELRALGPMSRGEWAVFLTFSATVALWLARPALQSLGRDQSWPIFAGLNDSSIAVLGALALFLIPIRPKERVFAMDWRTAEKLPWGVLLLFGGGLSLAAAISHNGVDTAVGSLFTGLGQQPLWLVMLIVTATVILLSELASNTAIASAILPILAAAAPVLGFDALELAVPAILAASLAFMMPVGTPPNAIAFATGRVTMSQMIRAGIGLNFIGLALIMAFSLLLGRFVIAR